MIATKPRTLAEIRARLVAIGDELRKRDIPLPTFHELMAEKETLLAEYRRLEAGGKP